TGDEHHDCRLQQQIILCLPDIYIDQNGKYDHRYDIEEDHLTLEHPPGGTAVTVGSDCKVFAEDRDGVTFLHTGDNQKFGQLIQTDQKCGNEGHRYDSVAFHVSLLKCIDNTAASRTDIIVAFIDGLCRGIVPAALTACAFRMLHFDSDIIIFNAVRKCVRNFDLGYDEQ